MRKTLLAIATACASFSAVAAGQPQTWIVEANYPDVAALARAASHFDHLKIDRKRQVARVETDEHGIEQLREAGLDVEIDSAATARLNSFRAGVAADRERIARTGIGEVTGGGYPAIPGYSCYRTVEGTYQTMDDLVSAHPGIATIDEIGPTWKKTQDPNTGYTMRALRITNLATVAADPDRPRMVVFSSIHAREYAPAEIDTRFAEWLVNNYGTDPEATWLVDHNDFRLILQANPDARKIAEEQFYQRKNLDNLYGACGGSNDESYQYGIDLNRNFPFHWNITNGQGSDSDSCSQTFRGPSASGMPTVQGAMEPETQNLVDYVAGTCNATGECTGGVFADHRTGPLDPPSIVGDGGAAAPDDTTGFFIDFHSNAALVLWPWGDTSSAAPNQSALRTLGRRIGYFNGYTPEQSDSLYPTDGTTDDTMYGLLGVASFTIEADGSDFFEDCASFDASTSPNNVAALTYAARILHAPYQLPAGPDALEIGASSDLIVAGDPVGISGRVDDTRFNQSTAGDNVRGTVENIAAASAYLDALPWQDGALGNALEASDGAFDSSAESISGTIDTSGLAPGRHVVYVQAVDVDGHAGPPGAAMFDVADASTIGTLAGQVTDSATHAPLQATLTLTEADGGATRHAISDATTGAYSAHADAGNVAVHVAARGYLAEDIASLDLPAGQSVTRNFALYPSCTIFSDDVEGANTLWSAQSPWVVSNGSAAQGNTTHFWNTPNYSDNLNASLTTTASVDLTGYADIALDYDDRCGTEPGYDYGYVEYNTGGSTWHLLSSCNGRDSWQSNHIDLPADANNAAAFKLRFRLSSDGGVNGPGWGIDNIKLSAGGDACRAQQPPADDTIFTNGFE